MNQRAVTPRLSFIDGLRGVAAATVLLFHIATSDFFHHSPGVVQPINNLFLHTGYLGVEIFFVISGFVIAYALRNAQINARYTFTFLVRRSLRLDPPYWAAIAATLLVCALLTQLFHATTYGTPSASTLLAHGFYLQGILGKPQILVVFWTLCYEIQFYLLYLLLQGLIQKLMPRAIVAARALQICLLLTGAASFAAFLFNPSAGPWAFNWWFLFALGASISREMLSLRMRVSSIAAALVFALAIYTRHPEPAAGALTALALIAAFHFNGLCTWLSNRLIQYLGRISYSLYLTHTLVLQLVTSLFLHLRAASLFYSLPAYLLMLALPLLAAELFYRLIEKPSHHWATTYGRSARPQPASPRIIPAVPEILSN
jgi:peptidoglycan/LPS O-acetylase OafA/YrhL